VFGLSQLIRFQTWQPVIRYGAEALGNNDASRLQRLIKFTTLLDMTAAVIGLGLVMVMIEPAGHLFEVSPDLHDEIRLYGFSIIAMIMASTPLGVLRLLDRFDLIAMQTTIAPAIRLAGTIFLFFTGGELIDFLAVWFIAAIVSRVLLLCMAWGQLRKRGLLRNLWQRHENQLMPEEGIWRFILGHNLSRGLFLSQAQIGLLMAGGLLGPGAGGIFRIAQQFSDILIKPSTKLLVPAIYPELAKLQATKDHGLRRSMILRTSLIAGGIAITVLVILAAFGKFMIASLVGIDYAGAYVPMLWLAVSGLITVFAFPLEPLLSSTGRIKQLVFSQLLATSTYIALVLVLVRSHGLTGVAMAALGAVLCSTLILILSGRDLFSEKPQ
jgi:O-antigen/teichoic acid export membrane protein